MTITAPPTAVAAPQPRSRRLLLGAGAAVAAGAFAVTSTPAAHAAEIEPELHLLRRATFGPTPAALAEVKKLGITGWLDAQLSPSSISDTDMDALLKRWPNLNLKTWECREKFGPFGPGDGMKQTLDSHVARAIWSNRQLFEVMVNFWSNHLVVPVPIGEVWDNSHLWQRDVIRRHALGKYADMLCASARHPAMLKVLDNADSRKQAPNENYGRELLELHTLGLGNYTEADVKSSALALTGLSIDADNGLYEYKPERRYVGPLSIVGWSSPNNSAEAGESVAMSYLNFLARQTKTAELIVRKLCVRFVADEPPASLVTKLVSVYRSNDTAIAPVLKALFTSSEFKAAVGQKLRTPFEDAVATLRIFETQPEPSGTTELGNVVYICRAMGQVPMGWIAPNGYPDVATAWNGTGSIVAKWNYHLGVAGNWQFKTMSRLSADKLLPTTLPATHGAYVDALTDRLLLPRFSAVAKAALCKFLGKTPSDALKSSDAAVGWRLPYVVALILDSYSFAVR